MLGDFSPGANARSRGCRWSSPSIDGVGQFDIGYGIKEIKVTTTGLCGELFPTVPPCAVQQYDLVISGQAAATIPRGTRDAFVAVIRNPFGSLPFTTYPGLPTLIKQGRYGDDGIDDSRSIVVVHPWYYNGEGFVSAGTSTSDFESVGDPSDMYLFKTDFDARTLCEIDYSLTRDSLNWDKFPQKTSHSLTTNTERTATVTDRDWMDSVCYGYSKRVFRGESDGASQMPTGSLSALSGSIIHVRYDHRHDAVMLHTDGESTAPLVITDVLGRTIGEYDPTTTALIPTAGWTSGTYLAHMRDGSGVYVFTISR
jgi:hypothetical protein